MTDAITLEQALQKVAEPSRAVVKMNFQNEPIEQYCFGEDCARLIKHIEISDVDDRDGVITLYIEAFEHDRFEWWRAALALAGLHYTFLDMPLARVAENAGVSDWRSHFRPSALATKLNISTAQAKEKLITFCTPLLLPDFQIVESDYLLRLRPITSVAQRDRLYYQTYYPKLRAADYRLLYT